MLILYFPIVFVILRFVQFILTSEINCREQGSSQYRAPVDWENFQPCAPSTSRVTRKWLNVILELDEVLCKVRDITWFAKENVYRDKGQKSNKFWNQMTMDIRLVVRRPMFREFLKEVSEFATVSIWSRTTIKHNATILSYFLFKGLPLPRYVFGSESCGNLKCKNNRGRIENYRWRKSTDIMFTKSLEELFRVGGHVFTPENTIIVDCNRLAQFMNQDDNVVHFRPRSNKGDPAHDRILYDELLPWLRGLHLAKDIGLQEYRSDNPVGALTLFKEPDRVVWYELWEALCASKKLEEEWFRFNPNRFEPDPISYEEKLSYEDSCLMLEF